MADDAALGRDIQQRIDREKRLIDGYQRLRQSADNPAVQANTDVQIRDSRRNIQYFESRLAELQARHGVASMSLGSNGAPPGSANAPQRSYPGQQPAAYGLPPIPGGEAPDYGDGGYSVGNPAAGPPRAPYGPAGPGAPSTKVKPNYSRLDLIKDDTPHLGPRIQLMLSQLQFKLNVEKQYKDGVEKIMGSYSMDGDRKIKAEAQGRRIESMQKIQLLQQALKRYEDLHLDMESGLDPADDDSVNAPTLRKPLTGLLSLRIHAISEVNHASTGRLTRGPETFVIVKVEDDFKGRTKATRTDKWTDEFLEIDIDKGNEVELTVYDKAGNDHPRPIGMLWIRISDIAEEMRRKKIETEFNQAGWVSADKMEPTPHFNPPPGSMQANAAGPGFGGAMNGASNPQAGPVVIDAWFSLEPVGRINLSMSFSKQSRERRPFDVGLNRKGAIRQRREDVVELYGHKFVAQSFYNIMRCAFCGNLLKYATGMQCTDCRFMCHEECYSKVVTKCISKSNAETDPDEAKLNHRIPHRFEAFSNISATWCCHCGFMLPLGKKVPRRCRECKLTAHADCAHLVPDFCGMSMEQASKIITEVSRVKDTRPLRTLRPKPPGPRSDSSQATLTGSTPSSASVAATESSQQQPLPPTPTSERYSYNKGDAPEQAPYRPPSGSIQAGPGQSGYTPQYLPNKEIHKRPVAARADSGAAAQAAAIALATKNGRSPTEARPPYSPRTSSHNPVAPSSPPPTQAAAPPHVPYDPGVFYNVDQKWGTPTQPPQPQPQAPAQMQPQYQPQPPAKAGVYQQQPQPSAPQPQPMAQIPNPQPQTIINRTAQSGPEQLSRVDTFQEKKQPAPSRTQGSGRRIGLDHFNFLAVLGKGNFGKVMLAETKATKQLYAIKVLKKEFIIENDEVESTKSERDVFIIANRARHPFLLSLHACFQTETRVYFVMEYISGGDLMLHIQRGQFSAKRAQFYAAEVCLALKYFHENGVVYRDLKLDNIMLTLDGHIKVADYGLCKKDMYYGSTTSTFCGTPEFMAPEILLDKKYGRAVDWWAFGVLIYQMLLQQSPFRGEDEDEIYDAILTDEPLYPIHMPRDSVSILQKLLTREPESRLGSGPTDAQEIMAHAFFRNINWEDIQEKRVPAPFLPQIKNATDTSNFDSEFTSVTPVLTPVQSVLSQAMQEEFRGFSYSADFE